MTDEEKKEIVIKGHDMRIPMPNESDFDKRVEWHPSVRRVD